MKKLRRRTIVPKGIKTDVFENIPIFVIVEQILKHCGKNLSDVQSRRRFEDLNLARHYIHYFLSINPFCSLKTISLQTSRHHASVIHSISTIEGFIEFDHDIRLEVIQLFKEITNAWIEVTESFSYEFLKVEQKQDGHEFNILKSTDLITWDKFNERNYVHKTNADTDVNTLVAMFPNYYKKAI